MGWTGSMNFCYRPDVFKTQPLFVWVIEWRYYPCSYMFRKEFSPHCIENKWLLNTKVKWICFCRGGWCCCLLQVWALFSFPDLTQYHSVGFPPRYCIHNSQKYMLSGAEERKTSSSRECGLSVLHNDLHSLYHHRHTASFSHAMLVTTRQQQTGKIEAIWSTLVCRAVNRSNQHDIDMFHILACL